MMYRVEEVTLTEYDGSKVSVGVTNKNGEPFFDNRPIKVVEDEFCKKFSTKEKLFVNCKMKIVWLK